MCMYVDNMINRNRNILVIILEMIIIDYSRVIAPVVADLCTTPVALSAPPNSF